MEIVNPYGSMVSFQEELLAGRLSLSPVPPHSDVYLHLDYPSINDPRLTYVRLAEDHRTVTAFVSLLMNNVVDGCPSASVGYAVPESMQNQGRAKQLFRDVIRHQIMEAGRVGFPAIYIGVVVDVNNTPSQRVAEDVLNAEREEIVDGPSGKPAYRYVQHFITRS